MTLPYRRVAPLLVLAALVSAGASTQAPVSYRLTFPEPEHRWMQVEATFPDVSPEPLQLRMSRSSPGRYALHEFAKNVWDVRVTNGAGRALDPGRPDPHQWDVAGHDGTVRVTYKVFGDRVDGTYLAIDSTHAHVNMPAALMWARGVERRPVTVRFDPPAGSGWRVATQLAPGSDPYTFTAPNLQYLMDSPSELSAFVLRTFSLQDNGRTFEFRVAVHHMGGDADVDAYARDVEKIVREMKHVFGEYPRFDHGNYTFIADYLPWASGDGMEHRNSTILTSAPSLEGRRLQLLGTASHEFFHAWNVERIRPAALEPFDFERANVSGELWFAEGFTSYYGDLVMRRAGLTTPAEYGRDLAGTLNEVLFSPGRRVRTAEEMSRFAPFVDNAVSVDRTNAGNTFISYYTWGAAIGLALDLTLRDRSDSGVSLDHFMRAMWQQFGKSGERLPGYVEKPYTTADLQRTLASVSGDARFASDFFASYIQGHDVADYARLLMRAGFRMERASQGAAWTGIPATQSTEGGLRVQDAVPFGSPAYHAGLERDDIIESIAGQRMVSSAALNAVLHERKPGEAIDVRFNRRGRVVEATLRLVESPFITIVPVEDAGGSLTAEQRRFRAAWLSSARPKF